MGGKGRVAPYLRPILPKKITQYLEPFGGGGAVLLGLRPAPSRLDIYNDFTRDLVNLFVCVRDRLLALLRELDFLPLHSRAEFDDLKRMLAREPLPEGELEPWEQEEMEIAEQYFEQKDAEELQEIFRGRAKLRDVQRAASYFKVCRGSFCGMRTAFGVKKNNIRNFFRLLQGASRRLQDVVIENKDAIVLIPERDTPKGLIYCDPPYYKTEYFYDPDFRRRDHVKLFHVLHACKGYVIVSYNDCRYIRNLYKDFFILTVSRPHSLTKKQGAKFKELIITNYDPRPLMARQGCLLFDLPVKSTELRVIHVPRSPLKKT